MEKNKTSKMTAAESSEQAESLRFMQQPPSWPCWPFLPVKSRTKDENLNPATPGAWPLLGFLFCDSLDQTEPKPRVYLGSMFLGAMKPNEPIKHIDYEDLAAVVADGWVVD